MNIIEKLKNIITRKIPSSQILKLEQPKLIPNNSAFVNDQTASDLKQLNDSVAELMEMKSKKKENKNSPSDNLSIKNPFIGE